MYKLLLLGILLVAPLWGAEKPTPSSRVDAAELDSVVLRETLTGVEPKRRIKVYLPPGYTEGERRFPVIYWFHGLNWDNERMFADGAIQRTLDQAIRDRVIGSVIVVAADFSTAGPGSFYENSPVSGRWLDFITDELVPFVDSKYRTLARAESRALCGEMMGAYGALKLAMLHPKQFSMAYGLHPVATGLGLVPMASRPDWPRVHAAKSLADLQGDGFSTIFVAMAQAYAPNPKRPPFFCDFMVEKEGDDFVRNDVNCDRLAAAFLLDHMIADYRDNLKALRGFAFDWGRYDANQDHVYANQNFSRKLEELGIDHLAEEYRGNPWEKNWTPEGRVVRDVLPFFARRLEF